MVFSAGNKVNKIPELWIDKVLISDCFIINILE
jgi:hypothetical protein